MSKEIETLRRWGCMLLCMALFLALLPTAAFAEQPDEEPVRVGWYEDSYNITGPNGERSGYGYEYEQSVAAYTGWDYEYVKGGWSELLEQLENGSIDLMAGISYTDDRAEKMLFSDLPMGEEKYLLYADIAHTDISASDLSSLNGKRIGLLAGSVHDTQFSAWEEKHGLHLQHVAIVSLEDALQKLEDHEIDCVVSTETPQLVEVGMSAILSIGGADIYFAINKNRPDLKKQLDSAMRNIAADKPFYADELYQRYLSAVSLPALSTKELGWLTAHGKLRIGCLKEDGGISHYDAETGTLTDTVNDYTSFAADCLANAPLEFELLPFDSIEDEMQALKDGSIDFIFHFSQNPYIAEQNGFTLSNTVLSMNIAAITAESYFNETTATTVAIEKNAPFYQWYISYNYPSWNILLCDSRKDAEKAVLSGEADCLLSEAGTAAKYSENKQFHSVSLQQPGNVSFAVCRSDTTLMSILNKTLRTFPASMLTGALAMHENRMQKVTLTDFIKDNLTAVAAACLTVVLAILVLILSFLYRSKRSEAKAKKAAAQAQELNLKLQLSQKELQTALLQAESANAAKTTFLGNVTHDVRTPMNAIIGIATLMANEPDLSEKSRDYLAKLQASSRHLLNLINEILDMNKIEAGKETLNIEPFSMQEQLTQIDSVVRPQAHAKGLDFTVTRRGILHDRLEGDATRLQQVWLNLLSNAVKYTEPGGHVSFETEELPRTGGYARYKFRIADNGIGMSEEFQKHIYDPFSRAENSVTNKVQGTGLGMSISKSLVEMMGGSISLESQLGKGSCFEVMLEFRIDPDAAKNSTADASAESADSGENTSLAGMRFLCAEDNSLNAEILQALLEMKGASCTIYPNGQELVDAFATVRPGDYDVILMDVMMPVMDGLTAARAIRSSSNPLGRTIPIVAMTANAFTEDIQKSRDAGMDAHLSKPVDVNVLEQTVRKFRVPRS